MTGIGAEAAGPPEVSPVDYDRDAEDAVVTSMLLDNRCIPVVLAGLESEAFTTATRLVFVAIASLHRSGTAVDLVTVRAALENSGDFERIGGLPGLLRLSEFISSPANVDHYVALVRGCWLRRRLPVLLAEVTASAGQGLPLDKLAGRLIEVAGGLVTCDWGDLRDLPPVVEEPPEMDPELIPPCVRDYVIDESDRLQTPPEMIVAGIVVAAGSVIGNRFGIFPYEHDSFLVACNLWGAVVARPSVLKKSPALKKAMAALHRLAKEAENDFDKDSCEASAKQAELKRLIEGRSSRSKKISSQEQPDVEELAQVEAQIRLAEEDLQQLVVTERRYITNTTTVEALADVLAENPTGILAFRDELMGLLRYLEKPGQEDARAFMLEAWDGLGCGTFRSDRIGRGRTRVRHMCLSVFGGIQPGPLTRYLSDAIDGGTGDDGLLQRLQVTFYPKDTRDWVLVDRVPDLGVRDRLVELFQSLDSLAPEAVGAVQEPYGEIPGARFTPGDAQQTYLEFLTELEGLLRTERMLALPAYSAHLGKYRSLMPKLAMIFCAMDAAATGHQGQPGADDARRARAWVELLDQHAQKVYAEEIRRCESAVHVLGDKILRGAVGDGETLRNLHRCGWSGLATPERVEEAVRGLEGLGWVRAERIPGSGPGGSGRPSQVIRLHPELRRRS